VSDGPQFDKVDPQVMAKYRLLLPILKRSKAARDAVRLVLDVIEGLPGGVSVLRQELHKRRRL
jgi:hypothetical protein